MNRKLTFWLSLASLVAIGAVLAACTTVGDFHNPKFLIATNSFQGPPNLMDVFGINPKTGALTKVSGSPFGSPPLAATTNNFLWATAVHPNGHWVFFAEQFDSDIQGMDLSASSGTPVALGNEVQNSGTTPWVDALKFDPSGKHLYSVDGNGNVSRFTIDSSTGVPSSATTAAVPGASFLQALVILSGFGYAIDGNTSQIFGASRDSAGALTPINGFPVNINTPNDLLTIGVDRSGNFVYVTTTGTDVFGYRIDQGTGKLTMLSGFPVNISGNSTQMSFSRDNKFIYMSSPGGVRALSFNSSTGALSEISGSPFLTGAGTSPDSVVVDPSNNFVYVGDCRKPQVFAYSRNQTTGALTAISGSPFATSGGVACGVNVTF